MFHKSYENELKLKCIVLGNSKSYITIIYLPNKSLIIFRSKNILIFHNI